MLTTLPALCRVSLISLAYFLCEKNGVEEIVRPRPPRDDPVTIRTSFNRQRVKEASKKLQFLNRLMVIIATPKFTACSHGMGKEPLSK